MCDTALTSMSRDELVDEVKRLRAASQWKPIETAPKDGPILLWFPDGEFACKAQWEIIEGGDEDGTGSSWAWMIADELSEQHDGVVWDDSSQPTMWQPLPSPPTQEGGE